MARRSIGIDIGNSHLRAVQLSQTEDQLRIEKIFTEKTRRSSDSAPRILRSLLGKEGFDRQAQMAIAMPHDCVFFKTVDTDSRDLEPDGQESAAKATLLNDVFPIAPENMIAKVRSSRQLPDNRSSVLTAAVCTDELNDRADTLRSAGIDPDLIEAPIFAIHAAVALNHPEIDRGKNMIACIDGSFLLLALLDAGKIIAVRNIPALSEDSENTETLLLETRITWQKAFGEEIEPEIKVYICAAVDAAFEIQNAVEEKLNCTAVIVDPYARMGCPGEEARNVPICLAQGLALQALAPEDGTAANFLESAPANATPRANVRRDVKICLALLAAVVVASFIGLFTRLAALERDFRNVNREIEIVFRAALPNEKNIAKPVAQIDNELKSLKTANISSGLISGRTIAPLEVLNIITRSDPGTHGIKVANILIAGEAVSLAGTSNSFEAVYNWQNKLKQIPQFSSVEIVGDLTRPDGIVNFKFSISLAAKEPQI